MQRSRLSLNALEIFQHTARGGSIQGAAEALGLSVSTVSHHLKRLEDSLGCALLDHGRRPMVLTPAGEQFLRHVDEALSLLQRGEAAVASGQLAETASLRLGLIEDFDSQVAPELAHTLARTLPVCSFRHFTRPSHDILQLLKDRRIDMGVATRPPGGSGGLVEFPLLRDPFVIALPRSASETAAAHLADRTDRPLLRYAQTQIIGRLIEAQLRRLRVTLPNRFELESNQSLMGMVAEGQGWAITTPTSFARAARFHDRIALHPFPGKGFARTLSLFAGEVHVAALVDLVHGQLSELLARHIITPVIDREPWLAEGFELLH
ncbi:LysR family transcriptional regulator [Aliiroseovarius sp.]|uniref:LysR family transcriptional regulator n=1 Tax=Aliiroseovarius sp. TaxID=1872442 RepID=UPI003BAA1892